MRRGAGFRQVGGGREQPLQLPIKLRVQVSDCTFQCEPIKMD